jgi:quercetin dioxygenase-like cupin family protein
MTDLNSGPGEQLNAEPLLAHIDVVKHRFDGPGYLYRGGNMDVGVLRLEAHGATVNHFHTRLDEVFLVLDGEATLWVDAEQSIRLEAGGTYMARAGEMHFFVNHTDQPFRAFFVKSPYDPSDTHIAPWKPGHPPPTSMSSVRAGTLRPAASQDAGAEFRT